MTKEEIREKYRTEQHNTKPAYEGKYPGGNAVLYSRFGSFEGDASYGMSVEMQLERARQAHPDLQITAAYIDWKNERTKLEELLSDIGKFNLVVIPSFARLRRNVSEALDIVKKLENSGVAIYFEAENLYLDGTQNLLLSVLSELAGEEARQKSESARRGWATRRRNQELKQLMPEALGYKAEKGKCWQEQKHYAGEDQDENNKKCDQM